MDDILTAKIEEGLTSMIRKLADNLGYSCTTVQAHLKTIEKMWKNKKGISPKPNGINSTKTGNKITKQKIKK